MFLEACMNCLWWNPIDCHLRTDGRIISKLTRAFPSPPRWQSEVLLASSLPCKFNTISACQPRPPSLCYLPGPLKGPSSGVSGWGTWQDAKEGLAGVLALPCCSKHRGGLLETHRSRCSHRLQSSRAGFWLRSSCYSEWLWVAFHGIAQAFLQA